MWLQDVKAGDKVVLGISHDGEYTLLSRIGGTCYQHAGHRECW